MDVGVVDAVADERARYRVARALALLGPPVLDLGPLRQALARPAGLVARGASRAAAGRVIAILAREHGLHAVAQPSTMPPASVAHEVPLASAAPRTSLGVKLLAVVGVLAVGALTGVVGLRAIRPPAPPDIGSRAGLARLASKVQSSRAFISGPGLQGGAGVAVAPGLILALAHAGTATSAVVRVPDEPQIEGTIVEHDADAGLVLVRTAEAGPPPLPLADAAAVADGDTLIVVPPIGGGAQPLTAIVTNAAATHDGLSQIQIEADIAPGTQGSPVLDREGRLIGLLGGHREGARMAWVVPVNYAFAWLPSPVQHDVAAWSRRVAARADATETRDQTFAAVRHGPVLLHAKHEGVDQYNAAQEIVVERFGVLISAPAWARTSPPAFRIKVGPCELDPAMEWWSDRARGDSGGRPAVVQAFERWIAERGLRAETIVGEASVPLDRRTCPTQGAREASLILNGTLVNTVPLGAP
jgi:serine protease Do